MTLSRSSSTDPKSSHESAPATMPKSPQRKSSRPSIGSVEKCQRNSSNRLSLQSRQRRAFLKHLEQWSLNHDSGPHFQGKISLLPQGSTSREQFELGKSVQCILTDSSFTDARQKIIIRLYPPQQESFRSKESTAQQVDRRDSMEPLSPMTEDSECQAKHPGERKVIRTYQPSTSSRQYKLVVRCGAGWIPAREYFSKIYFSHLEGQKAARPGPRTLDEALERRSQSLGPIPLDKDTVVLRPLFHPFLRLPQEMQDLILSTAAGISRSYNLCSDEFGTPKVKPTDVKAPISLATLFKVSKAINYHLIPHVYHSTDFEFGLTGFTNFLWQSGPTNRPEIRRLTFRLGKMALLHCLRWLAPNPVFSLFEPPVATNPRSLQFFWRCQIQDLAKELNLLTLTINISLISKSDLAMVVAILRLAFGSVTRLQFVESDDKGDTKAVYRDDPRLKKLTKSTTWRELCLAYFTRHRNYSYFFKFELLRCKAEDVDKLMDEDKAFFDSVAVC